MTFVIHTHTQRFAVSVEQMLSGIQVCWAIASRTDCILWKPYGALVKREHLLVYQMLSMISSSLKLYENSYSPVCCSWLQDTLTFQFPSAPHTKKSALHLLLTKSRRLLNTSLNERHCENDFNILASLQVKLSKCCQFKLGESTTSAFSQLFKPHLQGKNQTLLYAVR